MPATPLLPATSAFVDTTIVYDALFKSGTNQSRAALAALALYINTEVPAYALKELKAGPLQYLVWLHNCLVHEKKLSRVQQRVTANIQHQPRRASTAFHALAESQASLSNRVSRTMAATIGINFDLDTWQATEIRILLRTKILKGWKRRTKLAGKVGTGLTCNSNQGPTLDQRTGEIKNDTGRCSTTDCAMRLAFQSDLVSLKCLLDASAAQKTLEGGRRAAALEKLYKGCITLSDKDCRKLGDAVFAFFSPPSSDVLTTNVRDHRILASALSKRAVSPEDLGVA